MGKKKEVYERLKGHKELIAEYRGATSERKKEIKSIFSRHYRGSGIRGTKFQEAWREILGDEPDENVEGRKEFNRALSKMTHNQKKITLEDLKLKNISKETLGFEMRFSKELRVDETERNRLLQEIIGKIMGFRIILGNELTPNMTKNMTEIIKFIKEYLERRKIATKSKKLKPIQRRKYTIDDIFNKKDIKITENRKEIYQYWAGVEEDYEAFSEALDTFMEELAPVVALTDDDELLESFDRLRKIIDSEQKDKGFQYVFPVSPTAIVLKPNDVIAFKLLQEFGRARGLIESASVGVRADEEKRPKELSDQEKEKRKEILEQGEREGFAGEQRQLGLDRKTGDKSPDYSATGAEIAEMGAAGQASVSSGYGDGQAEEQLAFGTSSGQVAEMDYANLLSPEQLKEMEDDELVELIDDLLSRETLVDPLLNLAISQNDTFEAISKEDLKEVQEIIRNYEFADLNDNQIEEYEEWVESLQETIDELDETKTFMLPLTDDFATREKVIDESGIPVENKLLAQWDRTSKNVGEFLDALTDVLFETRGALGGYGAKSDLVNPKGISLPGKETSGLGEAIQAKVLASSIYPTFSFSSVEGATRDKLLGENEKEEVVDAYNKLIDMIDEYYLAPIESNNFWSSSKPKWSSDKGSVKNAIDNLRTLSKEKDLSLPEKQIMRFGTGNLTQGTFRNINAFLKELIGRAPSINSALIQKANGAADGLTDIGGPDSEKKNEEYIGMLLFLVVDGDIEEIRDVKIFDKTLEEHYEGYKNSSSRGYTMMQLPDFIIKNKTTLSQDEDIKDGLNELIKTIQSLDEIKIVREVTKSINNKLLEAYDTIRKMKGLPVYYSHLDVDGINSVNNMIDKLLDNGISVTAMDIQKAVYEVDSIKNISESLGLNEETVYEIKSNFR